MDKTAFIAGFCCCIIALTLFSVVGTAITEQPSRSDKGKFVVQYEAQTEPFLDSTVADLNEAIALRKDVTIVYRSCDTPRMYQQGNTITICAEAVEQAKTLIGDDAYDAITFSVYHETAHVLIDMYNIPFTGKEEDVADQFATMLLVQQGREDVALAGASRYKALATKKMYLWDAHSLAEQRYYNINCWVYGSSSWTHAEQLPQQRADLCGTEYREIKQGWQFFFANYLV
jgi:hypothetical protein